MEVGLAGLILLAVYRVGYDQGWADGWSRAIDWAVKMTAQGQPIK